MRILTDQSLRMIDVMSLTDPLAYEKAIMEDIEYVPDVDAFEPVQVAFLPTRLRVIQGGAARSFAMGSPNLKPCA